MPVRLKTERQREHDRRRRTINTARRLRRTLLIQLTGQSVPSLASRGGVKIFSSTSETVLVDNPIQPAVYEVTLSFPGERTQLNTVVADTDACSVPSTPVYLVELGFWTDEPFAIES